MNQTGLTDFLHAHATHPDAGMALALVAAQLDAARARRPGFSPTLGLLYFSDRYGAQAEALMAEAAQRWPGVQWVGAAAYGLAATGVEYLDEPALCVLLCDVPAAQFRVFNGRQPLVALPGGQAPWTALVHADPTTPDLGELVQELAGRTGSGVVFGGVCSARGTAVQLAGQGAGDVFRGGLSGVAFSREVPLISRVTQGCQPLGPTRTVTAAERNLVLELDGRPALPQLLADIGMGLDDHGPLMQRLRQTLVALSDEGDRERGVGGQFGPDTRVRHLIGLDPARQAVAVADWVEPGQRLSFCHRDVEAARRDLVRICAEIREEAEGEALDGSDRRRLVGAHYVSCTGRGGPHFGGTSAELQIVQHALGEVPLVGFFAAGEIARHHLYGYTGVLTVFTAPA